MFAFLRGVIAAKTLDAIHLDVNGIGYEVIVPHPVHDRIGIGREATLLTYCHIREDAFTIFGFLREEEKTLFVMLLSISGIGPKAAMSVLSSMSPSAFGRAIKDSDVTAFTRVPGIGKKTGQRIVLEMKAKLGQDAELGAILGEETFAAEEADDAIAALMSLGCSPLEAKKAAQSARKKLGAAATDEDVVRAALQSMARV